MSNFNNYEYYENLIKSVLKSHVNKESNIITDKDISITWFSKTLQNWKALAITNLNDNKYYELTFDGDKERIYLDEYDKLSNTVYNVKDNKICL